MEFIYIITIIILTALFMLTALKMVLEYAGNIEIDIDLPHGKIKIKKKKPNKRQNTS
ncbi:MAG: hypothetical protein H6578_09840 [Chitinophagales bacterium]|nr:hypothetical protein [Chitinophagales bacterium]